MRRLFLFPILIIMAFATQPNAQPTLNADSQKQLVSSNLSSMPLSFTENRGQWDSKALYKAEAGGATFWFCKDEVVYQFIRDTDELIEDVMPHGPDMPTGMPDKFNHPRYKKESMVLRAQFVGANFNTEIVGQDRLSHNNNYFIGNIPSKWATDVPNYSSITYKDIYPGIDLTYHGDGKGIKYDFIVNPGADISLIKIKYNGVDGLDVTSNGDLQAATRFGPVYERIPQIYQEIDGQKRNILGHYILQASGIFGFALEDGINPAYPVVIDPELVYSTYLGGTGIEFCYGVAVDNSGATYITGITYSTNFPTQNPIQTDQPFDNAFVTKLTPSGNSLIYSTYLGGGAVDGEGGVSIAADESGYAYITGFTYSSNFPTQNPFQTDRPGCDAFVTKLAPYGNYLIYSSYLGGNADDRASYIAVDGSGNAYVNGLTSSTDFPILNPYQTHQGPAYSYDVFVTKLSPSGNSLVYSTYLGGDSTDYCGGIAIDNSGHAYVTGYTYSTNFPTLNPFQTNRSGCDAFITKFSASGNSLIYSTYLGGIYEDVGHGIAIDSPGNAYVTGYTSSIDFPRQNAFDLIFNGGPYDAFVTKLSPSGNSLVYSTYLGGNHTDYGFDIAVDSSGNAYVTGSTLSTNFPTQNPYQIYQGPAGYCDAFVTKLSSSGNSLVFSTYLGGNGQDDGWGIAVNDSGCAFVTGSTSSSNFPTLNPYQANCLGDDAFVTKIFQGNAAPHCTLPNDTTLLACSPNQICLHGFSVTDPDYNLDTAYVEGGTFSGDSVCFMPIVGVNILRLIAIDRGGLADTGVTQVTINLNRAPIVQPANDTTIFMCALGQLNAMRPHIGTWMDLDNNLSSVAVTLGILQGDTLWFTPVEGPNIIKLVVTDSCGIQDSCFTTITVNLNHTPETQSPPDTTISGIDFSPLCLHGFTAIDQDDNLDSAYAIGGLWAGDSICFTPVAGMNLLKLVAIDGCGLADTATTIVTYIFAPECAYTPGDANNSGSWTGQDVTYSVRFFKGGTPPPYSCECTADHTWYVAGDVNGSCSFTGQDVTYMVRHFKGGPAAIPCPDCPPAP
jgi:hypothetical protein